MAKRARKPREEFHTPYPIRKVSGQWYKLTPYGSIDKKMNVAMRRSRGLKNDDE